jgi:hypothetical protein
MVTNRAPRAVQSGGTGGEHNEYSDHQGSGRHTTVLENPRSKRNGGQGSWSTEVAPSHVWSPEGSTEGMARPLDGGEQDGLTRREQIDAN